MERRIALLVGLTLVGSVALAAPSQARTMDTLFVTFVGDDATPDKVDVFEVTKYRDEDGTPIREEADEDGDGTVTRAERDAYVSALEEAWRTSPPDRNWTLDGNPVSEPMDVEVLVDNLRGPVEDPQELAIHFDYNATLEGVSHGDEHVLVIPEFQDCRGADGEHAPPSWVVELMAQHDAQGANTDFKHLSDDQLQIPCQVDGAPELEVTFTAEGTGDASDDGEPSRGSPAPGAGLAVIAALGAACVVGRNR